MASFGPGGRPPGNPNEGHRARLRERIRREGIEHFAPHEVLEAILSFAIPRRDVKGLAKALLERFGSLPGVLEAGPEELTAVPGIGEQSAALLALFLPVMRRYRTERIGARPLLRTMAEAAAYCAARLDGYPTERVLLLGLDGGSRLRGARLLGEGSLAAASVTMRQILDFTLSTGSAQVILAHNHPGGRPEVSMGDAESTRRLREALALLDIRLIDHLILCGGQYVCVERPGTVYALP